MFPLSPELHRDFRMRESCERVLSDELQVHLADLLKSRAEAQAFGEVSALE